ncbi:hypothetical protein BH09GEM1_BH09GEM1_22540 [soil metagenome]
MYLRHVVATAGTVPEPLFYNGSLKGRRYTPPGGPAGLYLSLDPSTPPTELRLVVFEAGIPFSTSEHDPIATIAVRARLSRIVDLTDADTCRKLDVQQPELETDWEHEQVEYLLGRAAMPATQLLALAAHGTGHVAGIKYTSVRTTFGTNVVIFPDRLATGEFLEVVDSTGTLSQRLEG